ncbi:hypothetical protein [Gallibacterium sp. ZY190522]
MDVLKIIYADWKNESKTLLRAMNHFLISLSFLIFLSLALIGGGVFNLFYLPFKGFSELINVVIKTLNRNRD